MINYFLLFKFVEDQVFEMQTQFKAERSSLPALCLLSSVAFYENNKPTVPVLKRVIQLAKEALNYLENNHSDSLKVIHFIKKKKKKLKEYFSFYFDRVQILTM